MTKSTSSVIAANSLKGVSKKAPVVPMSVVGTHSTTPGLTGAAELTLADDKHSPAGDAARSAKT